MIKQPTTTINRLHFTDLDPLRFEDLCLNLVSRLRDWKELNHFGRKGSDGGVDIHAIESDGDKEKVWFVQCKRYSAISKSELTKIVDKTTSNPSLPDKLLVIIACDLSRSQYDYLKAYSLESGIEEIEIWTATTLETKLYKDYKDLLFVYFGVRLEKNTKDNAARVKYSINMEKRITKDLIDHAYLKDSKNWKKLATRPYYKFITLEVYIHSIDDTTYPKADTRKSNEISPWFRTNFYDTYHNGIELWLGAAIGRYVLMNQEGYWELIDHFDERRADPKYTVVSVMEIGRIPYYNIVSYKVNGDEYTSEPHIYCRFNINGMPYEEIYYRYESGEGMLPLELDKEKRTAFPKN
ncbi:restriction endonuclease [Spirosoma aerolatum]|uniref:restriction endonuclease n=1 Tax=Spirosoma aerolatum TaxID=1211326 RepID=UPI001472D874|nr:restriction endonuclease [Spirosoma aerolatum]